MNVGTGNGNGQAVGQSNTATATASADTSGNSPPSGTDPTAGATATAGQTSPSNTNVTVKVGSGGDTGPVTQANDTTATAAASGTGAGGQANASATQTSPSNVNVVVRVASPGDNGAVSQTNSADASAGATLPPATGEDPPAASGSFPTDQSVTTSGTAGVTNASEIDQQIEQTPDGAVGPSQTAGVSGASATPTSTGSATTTQTGARNVNVSVRVGSPGSDDPVSQANRATATGTTPALGVVTTSGASNTNVSIVLPGQAQGAPAGGAWTWNWTWNSTWTPATGLTAADVAQTAGDMWTWVWQNQPAAGAATPPAASAATGGAAASTTGAASGTWNWTWTWTMTGGQTWTLNWQQPCDCSWTWNWVWDWSTGAPVSTPAASVPAVVTPGSASAQDGPGDFAPVEQSNDAGATATASVGLDATTTLDQSQTGVDPALGLQHAWGGQTIVNVQSAKAAAKASQLRAANLNEVFGAPIVSVRQRNTVAAEADVTEWAHLIQTVEQDQSGAVSQGQWAEADQWTGNEQVAQVDAQAAQSDARNANYVRAPRPNNALIAPVEQTNQATVSASADLAAHLEATIGQSQTAGEATLQEAEAAQVLSSVQTASVSAVVAQAQVANVNDLLVPAGSRATNPAVRQQNLVTTTATGADYSVIDASIVQVQDGDAPVELATAVQQASAIQSAVAHSPAQQANLLNRAGWLGVEPPDGASGAGPGPGPEPGPAEVAQQATSTWVGSPGRVISFSKTTVTVAGHGIAHGSTVIEARPGGGDGSTDAGLGGAARTARAGAAMPALLPPAVVPPAGAPVLPAAPPAPAATGFPRDERPVGPVATSAASSAGPAGPSTPCCGSATDLGVAASAPPAGGSTPAIALPSYKLAAPAPIGPQMPAPILGRSVTFPEPFERPG